MWKLFFRDIINDMLSKMKNIYSVLANTLGTVKIIKFQIMRQDSLRQAVH